MESPHPKFLGHLVKLRQLSSKTFPFLEGNMPMSAATSRRKEEENSSVENEKKKKNVPSYLSDRTDEVVIFLCLLCLESRRKNRQT